MRGFYFILDPRSQWAGSYKIGAVIVKGIGGVQPKKIDFVHFDICCSPTFLLSKMWSYFVQLAQLKIL